MGHIENNKICSVDGCENTDIHGWGMCQKHYYKWYNYGDPLYQTYKDRNNIILYDDYAKIELSNTGNYAIIDLEDVEKVAPHKWHERPDGYVSSTIDGRTVRLHSFVFGKDDKLEIDHIDRNRLNNRKSNFRYVSRSQNCQNIGFRSNNTSGVIGVSWNKRKQKWQAYIKNAEISNKRIHLGYFDDLEEAKRCRIEAEYKYFGEHRSGANDNNFANAG